MAAHSYWRVNITRGQSDSYCVIAELKMRNTAGGPNLATGGSPVASPTYYSGNSPAMAFDGSDTTQWESSNGSPRWLGYHFASPVEINHLTITCGTYEQGERPLDGDVQWSDDGTNWTTVFSFANLTWTTGVASNNIFQELPPADNPAGKRYWRARITKNSGGGFTSIGEIEFRGAAGGDNLATGGTAFASGSFLDRVPAKAFNENLADFWGSDNAYSSSVGNAWIAYDFVNRVDIREVVIAISPNSAADEKPVSGWIDYSDDGVTWTQGWSFNDLSWTPGTPNTIGGSAGLAPAGRPRRTVNLFWTAPAVDSGGGTFGPHRYWRTRFTTNAGSSTYIMVSELELRANSSGPNLATGGTPLTRADNGDNSGGNPASRAFDANPATYWESSGSTGISAGTTYLGYDFGAPVSIGHVTITCGTDWPTERPTGGYVEYSDDGTTWVQAWTFGPFTWGGSTESKTTTP